MEPVSCWQSQVSHALGAITIKAPLEQQWRRPVGSIKIISRIFVVELQRAWPTVVPLGQRVVGKGSSAGLELYFWPTTIRFADAPPA